MTNKYITTREFDNEISRVYSRMDKTDQKLDGLELSFASLKTKFNDELKNTVSVASTKEKWKFGIGMAVISGIISFLVASVV